VLVPQGYNLLLDPQRVKLRLVSIDDPVTFRFDERS